HRLRIAAAIVGPVLRYHLVDDSSRQYAIGCLADEWLDQHPTCVASGTIHKVDRLRTLRKRTVFVATCEIEPEAGNRFPVRYQFRPFHRGIEVQIDRRTVDNRRYLVVLVVVE